MKPDEIVCPMCSHTFDPADHAACHACPLSKDCSLVCCPVCGYETVDPGKSKLVQIASSLFSFINSPKRTHQEKEL